MSVIDRSPKLPRMGKGVEILRQKTFGEKSKTFVTPDFSDKRTWYYDTTAHVDEVLTTSDNTTYNVANAPIIEPRLFTARKDYSNHYPVVKKNDVVISSGFSIDYINGQVIFDQANAGSDSIKLSYSSPISSCYELIAQAGKKLLLNHVECQISKGAVLPVNDYMLFEAIYNGPAVPAMGIPANTDVVIDSFQYHTANDFINESNKGYMIEPFGALTKSVVVIPWEYMSGRIIKPVGDATTDISKSEFNKLRVKMNSDSLITSCEIATASLYCWIESL